jgi:hypothetical protein
MDRERLIQARFLVERVFGRLIGAAPALQYGRGG